MKSLKFNKCYNTLNSSLTEDFLKKILRSSNSYMRISGYFSMSWITLCKEELYTFFYNGGHIKLLSSNNFSKDDIDSIRYRPIEEQIKLEDVKNIDKNNYRSIFVWLLKNNYISMRVYNSQNLLHIKIGIFIDKYGDGISFSGSLNETYLGWNHNIEEIKLFRSWEVLESEYFENDLKVFKNLWDSIRSKDIFYMLDNNLLNIDNRISCLTEATNFENSKNENNFGLSINLFEPQKKAINMWIKEGRKLIFEMATGTGKTIAAIGCISKTLKDFNSFICFVVCPQNTLFLQWKNEIDKLNIRFDTELIADGNNINWRDELGELTMEVNFGLKNYSIIYTTFNTFSSEDFIEKVKLNKGETTYMLIVDEVHGIGSEAFSKGLLDEYDLRLGLSATPERWFDSKGTDKIKKYFGHKKYIFDINNALTEINPLTGKTYLAPYEYIMVTGNLTNEEIYEYKKLTRDIIIAINRKDPIGEIIKYFTIKRASIHKKAKVKYKLLEKVLEMEYYDLEKTIIFLEGEQIKKVLEILNQANLDTKTFTQDKGTTGMEKFGGKTEREKILKDFEEGFYNVLLAIKCLDEGIDIPSAETAILMSSSRNPREYIQRIGRVIRNYEGKELAKIYDFVIVPSLSKMDRSIREVEYSIFKKELERIRYISENAKNKLDVHLEIENIERRVKNELGKNR